MDQSHENDVLRERTSQLSAECLRLATKLTEVTAELAHVLRPSAEPAEQLESDIDLEAIAWAYQKLLAYGVGNTSMDQALMLDRLNLMLLGDQ